MKTIYKSISLKGKIKTGVIVIHGFTSNTGSVAYFAERLNKAGFDVEAPLLSGHGSRWENLNKVKFIDWIKDIEKSYDTLKKRADRIFISGISMGGVLACRFIELHPEISGLILINPAIKLYKEYRMFFLPIIKHFILYQMLSEYHKNGDIKDRSKIEDHYDRNPLKGVHEFWKLIRATKKILKRIHNPTIAFQSTEDRVIPADVSEFIIKNISGKDKKIIKLKNSYHLATVDFDKDIIADKSITFIKKISAGIIR